MGIASRSGILIFVMLDFRRITVPEGSKGTPIQRFRELSFSELRIREKGIVSSVFGDSVSLSQRQFVNSLTCNWLSFVSTN